MSEKLVRFPKLTRFYQHFLEDEDTARFICNVSQDYTLGTLQRLFYAGDKVSRRAAILAIGFLGDFSNNETIGEALADSDRAVRLLAEHNIRQIWLRQGSFSEQRTLSRLERLNSNCDSEEAIHLATQVIVNNGVLGEAWNQRAIAWSAVGEFQNSVDDCRETLDCNRYHFPAAVGMGQGYLQLDDAFRALDSFRLALQINPDLECLRGQIRKLERMLEGK